MKFLKFMKYLLPHQNFHSTSNKKNDAKEMVKCRKQSFIRLTAWRFATHRNTVQHQNALLIRARIAFICSSDPVEFLQIRNNQGGAHVYMYIYTYTLYTFSLLSHHPFVWSIQPSYFK